MFHRRSTLKVYYVIAVGTLWHSVPASTKGTSILSFGASVRKFLYDWANPVVVYTFVVEVVNPFETVARVCSHMVASGKS
jgi:hypothetical protein